MQCLYCGKELALLKRLTGSEFCSDAHKRSYQEEYNRLAVNRLLQAQPKAENSPVPLRRQRGVEAEAPEFLAGGKRAIEAPKPGPDPEREPIHEVSQVTAVPELPRVVETSYPEPAPAAETWQQPEPQAAAPNPIPEAIAVEKPDLIPIEMAGFIPEGLPIRDSELQHGLNVNGPSELTGRTHYPSFHPLAQPVFETLPMAALVGYEGHLALWPGEPTAPISSAEVKAFSGAGLSMNIPTRPSPPRGLGSAEKVRFSPSVRKAPDTTCEWQTETADFVLNVTFRETTRSESPAEIGFPEEMAGLAEGVRRPVETPPAAEMDGSPHAALEALAKLKEEVKEAPGRERGKRNNGTKPPSESEPVIDTAALEWLFSNRPESPADGEPTSTPSWSKRHQPEPAAAPDSEPIHREPAAAGTALAAEASDAVSAVAVEEPEPEAAPAEVEVQEVAPESPKVPQFVTIPVKVFVPSKPRLAPGSHTVTSKPEPELPRIEAQPLRPKMGLTTGLPPAESAVSNVIPEPESAEALAPVVESAPLEPVVDSVPVEPPVKVASRPVFEKASTAIATPPDPPKEPASESKRGVWKTNTILKTEDPAQQSAAATPPAPAPNESEITVPGFSFATPANSSFWGSLPTAAKITILAIVVVVLAAVIYLTSFSHKTSASADAAGPSIMMGEGGWVTDWAGDATGAHRGRQISIYKPSLKLSDYRISFQGRVENASIGWVFRAFDASNYYVMKLTQTSSGFKLMKYAVINGQEHEQGSVAVPQPSAGWFSIRVDVRGPKFNTFIDGQSIDVWTDEQLKTGGVGFLNDRGERADIKGIAISYLGVGK